MLSEAPVSLPGPVTLEGRFVGSRCSTEEVNVGKTNPAGKSLIVEVNGEEKRTMAWNKGGLRSSLWVSRDQRKHVTSGNGSQVHNFPVVGSDREGSQVGLSYPESIGPSWLKVGRNSATTSPDEGSELGNTNRDEPVFGEGIGDGRWVFFRWVSCWCFTGVTG
ncbi:hypothetical protein SO802_012766 [Lithocarpus litseifolius]|uniref:Uncharacterized protein n=1 Tax=Lithocarpus litseifolius TaxID=425828 RepID=A0AAW2D3R6_9ROSI